MKTKFYNLFVLKQGMKLYGISLSWLPAIKIDDCDDNGKNCQTHFGLYPDIIDAISQLVNFTWEDHKEMNNDWGLTPISGPFNRSRTFGGVFGALINGDYMFNTAGWIWVIDRYELIDFVGTSTNTNMLAVSPRPPQFDLGLFVRPFTQDSWIGKTLIMYKFILKLSTTIYSRHIDSHWICHGCHNLA